MKQRNQPVGEVECDRKNCTEVCKVFKFRPRAEGRKTVFTDKFYFECPKHGRIGSDGNAAVTEYVLSQGKLWSKANNAAPADGSPAPKNRTPAASTAPESSPSRSNQQPAPAKPTRSSWAPLIDLD